MGIAAVRAGEMRVALAFGAIVGQLKMPGSLIHKDLMHKPDSQQTFERSVDRDFVEMSFARPLGNLVVADRLAGSYQHFQNGHSAFGAVKLRRFKHLTGLRVQI